MRDRDVPGPRRGEAKIIQLLLRNLLDHLFLPISSTLLALILGTPQLRWRLPLHGMRWIFGILLSRVDRLESLLPLFVVIRRLLLDLEI